MVLFRDAAGSLFLHTHGLFAAFAFETANGFSSFLSRSKIATVENGDLKTFLEAKGQSRFLDGDGIAELLDARLTRRSFLRRPSLTWIGRVPVLLRRLMATIMQNLAETTLVIRVCP